MLLNAQLLNMLINNFKLTSTYRQHYYKKIKTINKKTLKLRNKIIDKNYLTSLSNLTLMIIYQNKYKKAKKMQKNTLFNSR